MKKDIEKYVLIAVLAIVIIGADVLAFFFPSKQDISSKGPEALRTKNAEVISDEAVGSIQNEWLNPPQWPAPPADHRLFLSDRYMIKPDGSIIAMEPGSVVSTNGITLGWAEEYGLDITDGNLELRDPDKDGFYNLLEYVGKTNPRDPQSHPPYVSNTETSRLRLDGVTEIPFSFIFRSATPLEGKIVFFLQKVNEQGRRASVRVTKEMSEEIQREQLNGFILGEYREKRGERMVDTVGIMMPYDESELDLLKPEINQKVTLIIGKTVSSPDSTADFIMLLPGQLDQQIKVKRASTFSIPQDPDTQYLLFDANMNEGAKIQRQDGSKLMIDVPVVTAEERNKVPDELTDATENTEDSG